MILHRSEPTLPRFVADLGALFERCGETMRELVKNTPGPLFPLAQDATAWEQGGPCGVPKSGTADVS